MAAAIVCCLYRYWNGFRDVVKGWQREWSAVFGVNIFIGYRDEPRVLKGEFGDMGAGVIPMRDVVILGARCASDLRILRPWRRGINLILRVSLILMHAVFSSKYLHYPGSP